MLWFMINVFFSFKYINHKNVHNNGTMDFSIPVSNLGGFYLIITVSISFLLITYVNKCN